MRPFQILRTLVLIYLLFNLVSCMASSLFTPRYYYTNYGNYGYGSYGDYSQSDTVEGPWSRADNGGGWGRETG